MELTQKKHWPNILKIWIEWKLRMIWWLFVTNLYGNLILCHLYFFFLGVTFKLVQAGPTPTLCPWLDVSPDRQFTFTIQFENVISWHSAVLGRLTSPPRGSCPINQHQPMMLILQLWHSGLPPQAFWAIQTPNILLKLFDWLILSVAVPD